MRALSLRVFAKINLGLAVAGLLPDGYHDLDMLNFSVGVFDRVHLRLRRDKKILCFMNGRRCFAGNSAFEAAQAFSSRFGAPGAEIRIRKGIPFGGGLGGSSADAAAVLFALDQLCPGAGPDRLAELALSLGADLPFMLRGGFARVKGKGEKVLPLPPLPPLSVVLLKTGRVQTKAAYRAFDLAPDFSPLPADEILSALRRGTLSDLRGQCLNALTPAALSLCPPVAENLARLKEEADFAGMSGSGSAVFGLFLDPAQAERTYAALKDQVEWAALTTPVPAGIEVVS